MKGGHREDKEGRRAEVASHSQPGVGAGLSWRVTGCHPDYGCMLLKLQLSVFLLLMRVLSSPG